MNATYLRIDLTRQLRDTSNIMFVLLMPLVMYLVFGVSISSGDQPIGDSNVAFYVMSSMAAYGAALAATTATGGAAVEQMQGWGRQVGLTPVSPASVVVGKVLTALAITAASIGVVHLGGLATGAVAPGGMWLATFLLTLAGASVFALFGFSVAMLFKSESALGVATGVLVLMSFVGNVFMPLSGAMLDFARFTPMYGFVGLVRWPLMEGRQAAADVEPDSLALLLANVVAWALVFGAAAVVGVQRGRRRQ
ncbi:ABC transporter permease [Zafaria sp. Z1313]|uniref:ABC transporter permease n=1 Tax=unclassified Zafaria TaxID=2828765 RepID=UPI002E78A29C|nr:ABC transporter permease [Zafaria sp. J156]MEE1621017.1 ABC transporter permease [Zafaria sp. J156]